MTTKANFLAITNPFAWANHYAFGEIASKGREVTVANHKTKTKYLPWHPLYEQRQLEAAYDAGYKQAQKEFRQGKIL